MARLLFLLDFAPLDAAAPADDACPATSTPSVGCVRGSESSERRLRDGVTGTGAAARATAEARGGDVARGGASIEVGTADVDFCSSSSSTETAA